MPERTADWSKFLLLFLIVLFVVHAHWLRFTQDDAFIAYRYARNLARGDGLVFNKGERVEGYTCFLWVILATLFLRLGFDVEMAMRCLGIAIGAACVILVYMIGASLMAAASLPTREPAPTRQRARARRSSVKKDRPRLKKSSASMLGSGILFIAPSLLVANGTFAYWSVSGLEAPLFTFFVLATVLSYLRSPDSPAPPMLAALATLTRPEGGLIFGVLYLYRILTGARRSIWWKWPLLYAIMIIPYATWKLAYYGDLLPNTFYAKAGFSIHHLVLGVKYTRKFLAQYGIWGILILPIVWRLTRGHLLRIGLIAALVAAYIVYIILIGGDVLHQHRFFAPLIPLIYLLFADSIVGKRGILTTRKWAAITIALVVVALTFFLPLKQLLRVHFLETNLVHKMGARGIWLRKHGDEEMVVAASTIGVLAYNSDVAIVDMLGLCDRHIARNPERLEGLASVWKERKFNVAYVLSRKPDYIYFSTEDKPSAPAELALFTSRLFRTSYYAYYIHAPEGPDSEWMLDAIFRRKPAAAIPALSEERADITFPNAYLEAWSAPGDHAARIGAFMRVLEVAPPDFAHAHRKIGYHYARAGRWEEAIRWLSHAIMIDDYCVLGYYYLGEALTETGRPEAAFAAFKRVFEIDPDFVHSIEEAWKLARLGED